MPQTLPWPKMPNIAGIKRRARPSRSLNCACKYFTTACAIVRRIVSEPGEAFMRDWSPCIGHCSPRHPNLRKRFMHRAGAELFGA